METKIYKPRPIMERFNISNNMIVQKTNDYNQFKSLDGNRFENKLHIKRLKESMQKMYLFSPIIVNEKMQVIDGQHRLRAISELGLDLYFIIITGYGLREVQVLNANSKVWTADDYLDGYCDLNKQNYIDYRNFKLKYKLGHNECMVLLTDSNKNSAVKDFYEGLFVINNYKNAVDVAEKLYQIEPFYKGILRRSFVYAINGLLKNKNFNFNEFIGKLKNNPTSLVDCVNTESYKNLIEEIYNFRRREKVSIKY